MINARVFFWLDPDRLNRQRAACEPRPQVVLSINTAALIDAYRKHLAVTPINTGNARRAPARRGAATFVPYSVWQQSGWASEATALGTPLRKRSHAPVEITISHVIPDVMQLVERVTPVRSGQRFNPRAARVRR